MENLEPKTRLEYFLNKIATNNSESSEQGGNVLLVTVSKIEEQGG